MNDMESFEKLAAEARLDAPPVVDVTRQVLAAIRRAPREDAVGNAVLYTFSALAAIAAAVVAFISIGIYDQMTDPLVGFIVHASRIVQ